jgi:hypothetical protein
LEEWKMKYDLHAFARRVASLAAFTLALTAGQALAGTASCTPETCTWEISVDGNVVMDGMYISDPDTGDISLASPVSMDGAGFSVNLDSMFGNVDPLLGFGLGATNTSGAFKSFAFAFSLPLGGLAVPINTYAEIGTTLTAFTDAGGSVVPTLGGGKIVDSQDLAFSPSFSSVDKGVDVGNAKSTATQGTVFDFDSASASILSGGPFDTMSVVVAFGLTDQTGVGLSGFVEQTAVPVPAAVWLMGSGLVVLVGVARRRAA